MAKKKPVNHRQPWSETDLRNLRHWAKYGYSARETATIMSRTVGAIKWAGMVNKVWFRAIAQVSRQKQLAKKRRKTGDMTVKL